MDTGAWLLASAGLLDGRKATIHWDEFTGFSEQYPNVDAVEDRFVLGKSIATCGGAATTFELALELIKRHHSPMFALEVAALFMHGEKRGSLLPQHRRSNHAMVYSATSLMRRNLEAPLPIPDLCNQLKTDQRKLEALFQHELGTSPLTVYRIMRLREARRMIELTEMSVSEISGRCGYQNASAMTRAYKAEFGTTPRDHRRFE